MTTNSETTPVKPAIHNEPMMQRDPEDKTVMLCATHPLQCTGYARVGAALANGRSSWEGHGVFCMVFA
jgi:predicted transcriptional regulator of viral defense system